MAQIVGHQNGSPPLELQRGGPVAANLSLTTPESRAFAFLRDGFQESSKKSLPFTFISTAPNWQSAFDSWLSRTFTGVVVSKQEHDFQRLISSLWQKTRKQVAKELSMKGNQELAHEVQQWVEVERRTTAYAAQGNQGKVFSAKQVTALIHAADSIKQA
jgi:hypothetical protein